MDYLEYATVREKGVGREVRKGKARDEEEVCSGLAIGARAEAATRGRRQYPTPVLCGRLNPLEPRSFARPTTLTPQTTRPLSSAPHSLWEGAGKVRLIP